MIPFSGLAFALGFMLSYVSIRIVKIIYPKEDFDKMTESQKRYFLKSIFWIMMFMLFLPSFVSSL